MFGKPHTERKEGKYINEKAKHVGERIVNSILVIKFILSLTCCLKDDPQTFFTG